MQRQEEEARREFTAARGAAAKSEAELEDLSAAYNGLEAHAFQLEQQLRALQQAAAPAGEATAMATGLYCNLYRNLWEGCEWNQAAAVLGEVCSMAESLCHTRGKVLRMMRGRRQLRPLQQVASAAGEWCCCQAYALDLCTARNKRGLNC